MTDEQIAVTKEYLIQFICKCERYNPTESEIDKILDVGLDNGTRERLKACMMYEDGED